MSEPLKDTQRVSRAGEQPVPQPIEILSTWMGRVIQWVQGSLVGAEAKAAEVEMKATQAPLSESELLRQRFQDNYDTILKLGKEDLPYLRGEQGRLKRGKTPASETEREAAKQLIQQTYRQAWGKLIDARYGYVVQADALKRLNVLKDHLIEVYPEGIPRTEPEKLLSVLVDRYSQGEPLPPALEALRETQRAQTAQQVSHLVQESLQYKALGGAEKGMNPTEFVSEKKTGEKLAIAKSANEAGLAREVAEQQGIEDPSVFEFLGGFQELAVSYLNILLGGRLGIPLAKEEGGTTLHAFVENVGNFHDFIEKQGREALQRLPTDSSQRFVFAELITRNEDCHGENILFSPTGDPIPIDFGQILNPQRAIRACYLEFSCLDAPINSEDKSFYQELDVEKTMEKLTALLKRQYPDQFKDPIAYKAIAIKLNLLKARLYMIKEGVKAGLNQRQLIALDLPPITPELEEMYRIFKPQERWPYDEEEPPEDLIGGPGGDWFGGYLARKGFQAAWNRAFDPSTGALNTPLFVEEIRAEIKGVQLISLSDLYTQRERELYATANYDWTELPRIDLS